MAKEEVRKILDRLPDDSSFEDIQHHIHTRGSVQRGLRGSRTGHYILIAFGVSMLLHLVTAGFSRRYAFFEGGALPALSDRPLLKRFEMTRLPVVENRSAPRLDRPPEDARLPSDRNAVARNRAPKDLPKSSLPYSRGEVADAYNLIRGGAQAPAGGQRGSKAEAPKAGGNQGKIEVLPDERSAGRGKDFASYLRRGGERARARDVYGEGISQGPTFRNENGGVLQDGDISFSTYDWDFAPYMLKLKERIEAHMFPPAAFSMYGLIDGKNVVRFRIGRNGALLGMEALGYEGSKALVETSVRAVELSNPFLPLPPNFPEQYLEVTGQFRYELIRDHR
ncbi:MAG: hypothetical protein A3F84_16685 [Candidatus Handelsmanbacteria bacterium RIFCSPLOWO2_12_FULL_64_10]|uniref:TonB C-terminal domain-containing protein n=1 Tax=Handelsmanbacteria sp. (strain RIFCSPLOWO2_12_FULL_64_10) TaxID=1817868 RepID=A0A1F6D2B5_HANXR|nr:MAG: hypothetical protein A3F84_16685 [Candidatus Handelsmanbacteria bacterium RIFCSPLOWO2_12_FULL_64_10]